MHRTAIGGPGCLQDMGLWLSHARWVSPAACRTGPHAIRTRVHSFVVPAHQRHTNAPATCIVCSCAGKAMQAPHSGYPTIRVLPGCSRYHAGVAGTTWGQPLPADSHRAARAAPDAQRCDAMDIWRCSSLVMSIIRLLVWYLGETQPRLPRRLSCSSPMASTSHTAWFPGYPSAPHLHRRHTAAAPWSAVLRVRTPRAGHRLTSPHPGQHSARQALDPWPGSGTVIRSAAPPPSPQAPPSLPLSYPPLPGLP